MSAAASKMPGKPVETPEMVVPHRTLPALLLSLVLHVILLTTLGVMWSREPSGTGEGVDRPVGIALVHRLPDRDRYVDAAEIQPKTEESESAENASSAAASAAPPADLSPPIDLAGILSAMKSTPSPESGSGLAGETSLSGDAFGTDRGTAATADGDETTTVLFGVSGSGSRFVYVFDRSDSMNGYGGSPLRAAKAELLHSLQTMSERQRFQIIFYNDQPKPFQISGMPLQLVAGEKSMLARATRYVESISAFGGTEHDTALKLALRMSPDVIFFLTDARIPRLSESELLEIQRRAERSGTTIHAIEFGPEPVAPGDSFLRELASQNNGQYRYIDVRRLEAATGRAVNDEKDAP